MSHISTEHRKELPEKDFALPGTRSHSGGSGGYPIDTAARARDALSRVSANGSPSEKKEVREKVHEKFPDIGEKKEEKKSDGLIEGKSMNIKDLFQKVFHQG